jgi:DNA polymerase-3 subunit chi
LRVLVGGAEALPIPSEPVVILLFDGRDEDQLTAARGQWTTLKGAGAALSYWREGPGGWEKAR